LASNLSYFVVYRLLRTLLATARVKEAFACATRSARALKRPRLSGERFMKPTYLAVIPLAALTLGAVFGLSESRVAQAQAGAVHVRAVDLDAIIQKSSGAKAILADF